MSKYLVIFIEHSLKCDEPADLGLRFFIFAHRLDFAVFIIADTIDCFFHQVIAGLWLLSVLGSCCNFLTLFYISEYFKDFLLCLLIFPKTHFENFSIQWGADIFLSNKTGLLMF